MQYVCDAAGQKTWFRIETEVEAVRESELMRHAVEKHFRRAHEQASQAYRPAPGPFIEQDIGRAELTSLPLTIVILLGAFGSEEPASSQPVPGQPPLPAA